jgi:hypothetical protein
MPSSLGVFEALLTIASTIGERRDPADLARVAIERAYELVGGYGVCLYVWNESSAVLHPLAAIGADVAAPFPSLTAGEGAAGQAFQQRRPIQVEDYSTWEHAVEWASSGV